MKVILNQDVKNVGKKGEVKEVSEGYGRNYLLPRGLAVEANAGTLRQVAHEKKTEAKKSARELSAAQAEGAKIDGKTLELKAKVGDAGKLFGSVTSQEIADQLQAQFAVEIDRRKIDLKEPIKSLGSYDISIKIHPKVHVSVKVQVVAE